MNRTLRNFIKQRVKYRIVSEDRLQYLNAASKIGENIELILRLPREYGAQLLQVVDKYSSQLGQDLFVLAESGFKRNGYFVEFGATDGVGLSNTHILEKEFGWNGILAEPARCWHRFLKSNRTCHIETDCVWTESNLKLTFNEVDVAELSTINTFSDSDHHDKKRHSGRTYEVRTISLMDMLDKYHAPNQMDYLSIDTEGSEYDILSKLDFEKYQFKVITCEHNFAPARDKISALLAANGYVRKYEELSKFDDWYVRVQHG